MKKVFAMFLILIIGFSLSSCHPVEGSEMVDSDQKIANEKLDEILEAIQSKNKEMFFSLFSKNTCDEVTNLSDSIDEVFNYFVGEVESYYDWGGCYAETSKEYGKTTKAIEATYDVKTTECKYRFSFRYIVKDSKNKVGIQSLYIINFDDDTDQQAAYWGDGKYTPGINIGKTWPEEE